MPLTPAQELAWLQANPHFDERPATITDFLGGGYLECYSLIRPGIREALIEIFGEDVNPHKIARVTEAMVTGAIGIGKTTIVSIALPYMAHWVLCLKDPQGYFSMLPGSRIAFMQMSTSEDQAKDVVFGDIKARIEYSPWFRNKYPYDPKFTARLKFEKDIWVLPGDSADTTFEGYNILGGIVDEADSHKITTKKDYAEDGFNAIESRVSSRFGSKGLVIVIGQMKKSNGFAARKYKQMMRNPDAHAVRMTIWESRGWDHYRDPVTGEVDFFYYDSHRKLIIPKDLGATVRNRYMIKVPSVYENSFRNNPEIALRDLAGIPPSTSDPFISLLDRVDECRTSWHERTNGQASPVTSSCTRPAFKDWFRAPDNLPRALHVDIAYSGEGDAMGIAMGHILKTVELDDEEKPYIVFDFLMRIRATPGSEIFLSDMRKVIYDATERGFKIREVTFDGFQSQDTMQQLKKRRYKVDKVSVDREKLPYEDLRDAIYERRVEFPEYMTQVAPGNSELVEIAYEELSGLRDTGRKIDHHPDGSKDVTDAMAAVVYKLMGDRGYKRKRLEYNTGAGRPRQHNNNSDVGSTSIKLGGYESNSPVSSGLSGLVVPDRLRVRRRAQ
jgi:hypothetical protein